MEGVLTWPVGSTGRGGVDGPGAEDVVEVGWGRALKAEKDGPAEPAESGPVFEDEGEGEQSTSGRGETPMPPFSELIVD